MRCPGHPQRLVVAADEFARERFGNTERACRFHRGGGERRHAGARQLETAEHQIAQAAHRPRHLRADRWLARLGRRPAGALVVGVADRLPDAAGAGDTGALADRVDLRL